MTRLNLPGTGSHPAARVLVVLSEPPREDIGRSPLIEGAPADGVDGVIVLSHAQALDTALDRVPVEALGHLNDPQALDSFLTRVYCHARWREVWQQRLSKTSLQRFHSRYKYLLMASDRQQYQALGRAVAQCPDDVGDFAISYIHQLLKALRSPASRKGHTNVLQHLAGYLKRDLGVAEKRQLHELILTYRAGDLPLEQPIEVLKKHFSTFPHSYIADQAYLQPYPQEIRLRHLL